MPDKISECESLKFFKKKKKKKKKECENFEEIYKKVAVVRAPNMARPLTHQGNQLYFVNYIMFTLK